MDTWYHQLGHHNFNVCLLCLLLNSIDGDRQYKYFLKTFPLYTIKLHKFQFKCKPFRVV